jgi:hypothetical protein
MKRFQHGTSHFLVNPQLIRYVIRSANDTKCVLWFDCDSDGSDTLTVDGSLEDVEKILNSKDS